MKLTRNAMATLGLTLMLLAGTGTGTGTGAPAAASRFAPDTAPLTWECPPGHLCVWENLNGTGRRCNWSTDSPDWSECSWAGGTGVKSITNNGPSSVHLYLRRNYIHFFLCLPQGASWTAPGGVPPIQSHRWVSEPC